MAWEVWWALVLGFAISAIVQAWAPRERIERALRGGSSRPSRWPRVLGAASSSCSYAAIAIAKSLFQKGASAASALAFQFASTNLVWELGLVLWVLIGWQFTVAEYLGGIVMIVLMTVMLRLFVSPPAGSAGSRARRAGRRRPSAPQLRRRAELARARHLGARLVRRRPQLPRRLADALEGDHDRLPAGRVRRAAGQRLLREPVPAATRPIRSPAIENVIVGPMIAILSFVCSVGNVPLAAVLWSGGISFAACSRSCSPT